MLLYSVPTNAADSLPRFYSNIEIVGIETWPDASNPTYGYMIRMEKDLNGPGCSSSNVFSVKAGEFQSDTLSILLSAMMADKKIRVRVYECSDRPLVDRVEILK